MKRVLAVTGIRSEYFLLRSTFQAIQAHPELELGLVVTGAHLSPAHGLTVRDIEADGLPIWDRVESLLASDRDSARIKGAASQLQVLSHLVDRYRPDWLLAPTDREEAMMVALCGAYMNIPIAHYSAGDRVVGNVDDSVRHAISRLSHLLLTTSEDSRQRLIRSGEQAWRVHNVGHGGLDRIRTTPALTLAELATALAVPAIAKPFVVVIQHPITSEIGAAGEQMRETLAAVAAMGCQAFVSCPNSDAGSREMLEAIEAFSDRPGIHSFRNIPDIPFINLLNQAEMLIGNSSLGVLEAPFLHLPVINVGNRQGGRHHSENIFFVAHDREQIVAQAQKIRQDPATRSRIAQCGNPFGDGHTGAKVAELLARTAIDSRLLNKDLTY
jgi:GDP/UDP-N,N'-diacetylbacillosamine 2-epimerase (hydrolysing)